jgi:hypothetical protein
MSDAEVEAAIAEWQADNPDQPAYAAAHRLHRLNADARQRAEDLTLAEAAGVSVSAIRKARAEKAEREAYAKREGELAAARAIVRQGHTERQPGRPRGRSRWTADLFGRRWREACSRAGRPYTYPNVAPKFEWLDGSTRIDADPEYLGRLWRKWGRPEPSS